MKRKYLKLFVFVMAFFILKSFSVLIKKVINLDNNHDTKKHGLIRSVYPEVNTSSQIDLKLLLSPLTNVLKYDTPTPLPGYRNPCFEIDFDDVVAYGKSRKDTNAMFVQEELQSERGVRKSVVCFPSVYLMGVAKCGSTELTRYMETHQSVYYGK